MTRRRSRKPTAKQIAAATQAASAVLAEFIEELRQAGFIEAAAAIHQAAMRIGARKAVAMLQKGLIELVRQKQRAAKQ